MNNMNYGFASPGNEPVKDYAPGSPERARLMKEIERQASIEVEIPLIIGGKEIRTGDTGKVVMPCEHDHTLAVYHKASEREVGLAIDAALEAKRDWEEMPWNERASITLRAAELISGRRRDLINAATMLGQGKNILQAEIDAVCETIDFIRYNAHFASLAYQTQPLSEKGQINRMEYRALEGFVFTVSPFNFTAIASNLNMSVALMGNTTVWKPATTSLLSSYYLMRVFEEAGLPGGVINFVPGSGALIGGTVLKHPDLAGIHFTGSNATFDSLWKSVADNLGGFRTYPRLVGETGGKDFIFAHSSADHVEIATAIVRGAFEYQGQKCSAASRAYIPVSLWEQVCAKVLEMISAIRVGDVRDPGNFVNAVIDEAAFDSIMGYIETARSSSAAEIIAGGNGDKSKGYYIEPTVIVTKDPHFRTMEEEIFGPVMTIYVYADEEFSRTLETCDSTSPYGLTGAIFSRDRYAALEAARVLRHAAGNFYFNDKPTGAMVGLQPFGGARRSGTNDKSGGPGNLLRWTSPRTIKETLVPPVDFRYPFMGEGGGDVFSEDGTTGDAR